MCVPRAGVEERLSTEEQEGAFGRMSALFLECGGGDATEYLSKL